MSAGEVVRCSYERQPETATIQTVEGGTLPKREKILERDSAETRRLY